MVDEGKRNDLGRKKKKGKEEEGGIKMHNQTHTKRNIQREGSRQDKSRESIGRQAQALDIKRDKVIRGAFKNCLIG